MTGKVGNNPETEIVTAIEIVTGTDVSAVQAVVAGDAMKDGDPPAPEGSTSPSRRNLRRGKYLEGSRRSSGWPWQLAKATTL